MHSVLGTAGCSVFRSESVPELERPDGERTTKASSCPHGACNRANNGSSMVEFHSDHRSNKENPGQHTNWWSQRLTRQVV